MFDPDVDAVRRQFEKEFVLVDPARLTLTFDLPDSQHWFKTRDNEDNNLLSEFRALKTHLNSVKSKLNHLPLSLWHAHTRGQNPAGEVIAEVKRIAKGQQRPELMTQAWCKFTECIVRYDLVGKRNLNCEEKENPVKDFNSIHLCEAPGGFITALNHYLKTQRQDEFNWNWLSNTLNPYHESNSTNVMINDDRFIFHTLDKWIFGHKDTGDILDKDNRADIVNTMKKKMKRIDLVTADGSVDCQSNPADQEKIVSPLHWSEVAMALNLLSKGGNFVLKMFTFFESESINMLLLLQKLFAGVSIFKPATSKEGNSEVYVVCTNYNDGLTEKEKNMLLDNCHRDDVKIFSSKAIPPGFLSKVFKCCKLFEDLQVGVIERNLRNFDVEKGSLTDFGDLRRTVAWEFVRRYNISPILKEDKILSEDEMRNNMSLNFDERHEEETFEKRIGDNGIAKLRAKFESHVLKRIKFRFIEWTRVNSIPNLEFNLAFGAPVDKVFSSKFCTSRILDEFQKVKTLSETSDQNAKRRKTDSDKDEFLSKLCSIQSYLQGSFIQYNFAPAIAVQNEMARLKRALEKVPEMLNDLERGQHLILRNIVFLTRLQVALLLIIGNCFEEIGFLHARGQENGVVFSEFKGDAADAIARLTKMKEELDKSDNNMQLVQVYSIPDMVGNDWRFYSCLTAYNFHSVKSYGLHLLSKLNEGA